MKKMLFGFLTATALTMSLASCGEKLLTPEQVNAKIEEGFTAGQAAIVSEMSAKCDADFESRVTADVQRITAEDKAKMEAEKAAAAEASKMKKKKK
jgi:predicted small lipoprotein YifL